MECQSLVMVCIRCATYNHEPYIRECLEGFVMQKTDFRFVAIVHDDASTDKTADIIREYEAKYPDIIKPIYETENQYSKRDGSLGRIMNAAIDAIGAKYVAMCEGDDYWTDPLKLQKQVDFMEEHEEYGFIGANCMVCKGNELTDDIDWFAKGDYLVENGVKELGNVFESAICGSVTRTCTLLYKKKIIYEKYGRFVFTSYIGT